MKLTYFCLFRKIHTLYSLTFEYFVLDYQEFFFEKVTEIDS